MPTTNTDESSASGREHGGRPPPTTPRPRPCWARGVCVPPCHPHHGHSTAVELRYLLGLPECGGKTKSRISIMQSNLLILERGKPRGREERKQRTQRVERDTYPRKWGLGPKVSKWDWACALCSIVFCFVEYSSSSWCVSTAMSWHCAGPWEVGAG